MKWGKCLGAGSGKLKKRQKFLPAHAIRNLPTWFSIKENEKLPRPKGEGEMKRVARPRKPPVVVPLVVVTVDVHIALVIPAIEGGLCSAPPVPPLLECSRGWILFDILNVLVHHTKYLHFLWSVYMHHSILNPIQYILDAWILISATSNHSHLHIYLLSPHSIQTKRASSKLDAQGLRSKAQKNQVTKS